MTRSFHAALVAAIAAAAFTTTTAYADTVEDHVATARRLIGDDNFIGARLELLAAWEIEQRPELLFALGQVELNLGHDADAIAYYERFLATNPPADQAALAQQAIGAARLRMATPPPEPVKPPPPKIIVVEGPRIEYRRTWGVGNTVLVGAAGAAAVASGILFVHARGLVNDRGGTISDYDHRVDRAHTQRLLSIGLAAGSVVATTIAIVRWRVDRTEVRIAPTDGGAALTATRAW